jgi:hypothetical protein
MSRTAVSQHQHNTTAPTHRDKVHLFGPPEGRAHIYRPAYPEAKEDRDVDVRGEEVLRIPLKEDLVAVDEDEDRRPEDTPDGEPWLQRVPVRELAAIKALYFMSTP